MPGVTCRPSGFTPALYLGQRKGLGFRGFRGLGVIGFIGLIGFIGFIGFRVWLKETTGGEFRAYRASIRLL